jgi:hypothetical protein
MCGLSYRRAGGIVNQLYTHHVPLRIAPRVTHVPNYIHRPVSRREGFRDFAGFKRSFLPFLLVASFPGLSFYENYERGRANFEKLTGRITF